MNKQAGQQESSDDTGASSWLPGWFKIAVIILTALIMLKVLGLEVFIEIDYGDEPLIAGLTEAETYFIPLGLLLVYFVVAWLWKLLFGRKDV